MELPPPEYSNLERLLMVNNVQVQSLDGNKALFVGLLQVFLVILKHGPDSTILSISPNSEMGASDRKVDPAAPESPKDVLQVNLTPELAISRIGDRTLLIPMVETATMVRVTVQSDDLAEWNALLDLLALYTAFHAPPAPPEYRDTLALVDTTGAIVGKLDSTQVDTSRVAKSSQPLILGTSSNGQFALQEQDANANPFSEEDWLVQGAVQVSAMMVSGATMVAKQIENAGTLLTANTKATEQPLVFTPTTRARIDQAKVISDAALKMTQVMVSSAVAAATVVGGVVASKLQSSDATKPTPRTLRLTSSFIKAVGYVSDGIKESGKLVMKATGRSAGGFVDHRYGGEAGEIVRDVARIGEKLWVVYFDANGIRRAVLMTGAKSTIHSLSQTKTGSTENLGKGKNKLNGNGKPPNSQETASISASDVSAAAGTAFIYFNNMILKPAVTLISQNLGSASPSARTSTPTLPPRK
jgi:hypothetical protein